MSEFLSYNGKFYRNTEPIIPADNRGLRYGDGLFETMRQRNGEIHLSDWHMERLFTGLALLQFDLPPLFTPAHVLNLALSLCKKNDLSNGRIRINIIRGNGGLYDPDNHVPNIIIQTWPLPDADFHWNDNGLITGIYDDGKKAVDKFANSKTNQYLVPAMAAMYAKKNRWNDAILVNTSGNICDSTIANVFIIKDAIIMTPALTEGCVAGVMRRFLLEQLTTNGYTVRQKQITTADLLTADEAFLTNSIQGIRWIKQCENARYSSKITTGIFEKLLKK